ncbi:hypothetical protein SNEBB_001539 [Seison nebaliae]|nr:hypothetical protein SNEBB_001539 [Seison nebaliae]
MVIFYAKRLNCYPYSRKVKLIVCSLISKVFLNLCEISSIFIDLLLVMNEEWKDQGGYMNAKMNKLRDQLKERNKNLTRDPLENEKEVDSIQHISISAAVSSINEIVKLLEKGESRLFEAVGGIFVNGFTQIPIDIFKRLIIQNGGKFQLYEDEKTTHIIADELALTKHNQLKKLKYVKPKWIFDSIAENELKDEKNYLTISSENEKNKLENFFKEIQREDKSFVEVGARRYEKDSINFVLSSEENSKKTNTKITMKTLKKSLGQYEELMREEKKKEISMISRTQPNHKKNLFDSYAEEKKTNRQISMETPNDISEFFARSRLHQISQWKKECLEKVEKHRIDLVMEGERLMRNKSERIWFEEYQFKLFSGRRKLLKWIREKGRKWNYLKHFPNIFLHIDFDCFFASVAERDNPSFVGKPIIVTHHSNKENGEGKKESYSDIASCNYVARSIGIENGMVVCKAEELLRRNGKFKKLNCVPYDFASYQKASNQLYDFIQSLSADIVAISCDELYLNLTNCLNELNEGVSEYNLMEIDSNEISIIELVLEFIREKMLEITNGLSVSIGCSTESIYVARLATMKAKPKNYLIVYNSEEFMKNVPLKKIPLIGTSTFQKLHNNFPTIVKDSTTLASSLLTISLNDLQKSIGQKNGEKLFYKIRGNSKGFDLIKFPTSFSLSLLKKKRISFSLTNNFKEKLKLKIERSKSISVEINFALRYEKFEQAKEFIKNIFHELSKRMNEDGLSHGSCIATSKLTMKLRVRDFEAPVQSKKWMGMGYCRQFTKSEKFPLTASTKKWNEIGKKILLNLFQQWKTSIIKYGNGNWCRSRYHISGNDTTNGKTIPTSNNFSEKDHFNFFAQDFRGVGLSANDLNVIDCDLEGNHVQTRKNSVSLMKFFEKKQEKICEIERDKENDRTLKPNLSPTFQKKIKKELSLSYSSHLYEEDEVDDEKKKLERSLYVSLSLKNNLFTENDSDFLFNIYNEMPKLSNNPNEISKILRNSNEILKVSEKSIDPSKNKSEQIEIEIPKKQLTLTPYSISQISPITPYSSISSRNDDESQDDIIPIDKIMKESTQKSNWWKEMMSDERLKKLAGKFNLDLNFLQTLNEEMQQNVLYQFLSREERTLMEQMNETIKNDLQRSSTTKPRIVIESIRKKTVSTTKRKKNSPVCNLSKKFKKSKNNVSNRNEITNYFQQRTPKKSKVLQSYQEKEIILIDVEMNDNRKKEIQNDRNVNEMIPVSNFYEKEFCKIDKLSGDDVNPFPLKLMLLRFLLLKYSKRKKNWRKFLDEILFLACEELVNLTFVQESFFRCSMNISYDANDYHFFFHSEICSILANWIIQNYET